MGLKTDIKNAFLNSMGYDDMPSETSGDIKSKKNMEKKAKGLSDDISKAIIDFLQKQEFTITKMKASLEVEELKTTGPLVGMAVGGQTPSWPGGVTGPLQPVTPTNINKLGLSKKGGQGGVLKATGHAYIGRNPVPGGDTNENETTVKLIDVTGE
ncbi:MAG: hypothetical protein H8D94_00950 [Candidatus Pelagibacter sp.]|nr:hypothetical protein [Candidatus Pelagibacter sp.]